MSSRTTTEPRSRYDGPAEIWVSDAKRFDADVSLTGYVDVTEITTFGGTETLDGVTSWDGRINSLSEGDYFALVGQVFELKLPSGRTGKAVLPQSGPYLRGSGVAPF